MQKVMHRREVVCHIRPERAGGNFASVGGDH
jgi:hypothetical protein